MAVVVGGVDAEHDYIQNPQVQHPVHDLQGVQAVPGLDPVDQGGAVYGKLLGEILDGIVDGAVFFYATLRLLLPVLNFGILSPESRENLWR